MQGNRGQLLINAVNDMKNTVADGDTFVLYIASQAYAFETGDEIPIDCHYNTVYPHWNEVKEFSGDEYLYLSTANSNANDYITDDDFAELFKDPAMGECEPGIHSRWPPYSGGFFGGGGGGEDSGDLLAAEQCGTSCSCARESEFAWMLMDDTTGLGINTFGADLAATLLKFRNDTEINFADVFIQTNHQESVYRQGLTAVYLAESGGFGRRANMLTTMVGARG